MVKNDLREMGYSVHDRHTKGAVITALWWLYTLVLMIGTPILSVAVIRWRPMEQTYTDVQPQDFIFSGAIPLYMLVFILSVLFYLGLKLGFTFLFCSDRINSIRLKILERKGLPVCHCREGLKVWQTVVIYLAPVIIVYVSMFLVGLTMVEFPFQEIETGYMTMLLLMSYFFGWDLTLITYVLAIKARDKIDYIAINRHIYEVTLYRATYIRLGRRASKKRVEEARQKRNTRVFTKMTTCANINCDNYGENIGEKTKSCPLCGRKRYIAEVFTHVITCVNPKCENFGYELRDDIKECSNCGEEPKNLALKFRPDLVKPTIIMTFAFTVAFSWISLIMTNHGVISGPLVMIVNGLQYAAFAVCIVRGWISKNKWVLMFAAAAFLFVRFGLGVFIV